LALKLKNYLTDELSAPFIKKFHLKYTVRNNELFLFPTGAVMARTMKPRRNWWIASCRMPRVPPRAMISTPSPRAVHRKGA